MNTRKTKLLELRSEIPSAVLKDNMSEDEYFQNAVLRPIIKFQNDLLNAAFVNYICKHKNLFHALSTEKRVHYIENAILKDHKFRNSLKGTVIGLFTTEEYAVYIKNSSALNKRMMQMVKDRLISNLQLFSENKVTK